MLLKVLAHARPTACAAASIAPCHTGLGHSLNEDRICPDADLKWVAALRARRVLVSEVSSRALDELQAADVATGWARGVEAYAHSW
jgi:hypothetical protein